MLFINKRLSTIALEIGKVNELHKIFKKTRKYLNSNKYGEVVFIHRLLVLFELWELFYNDGLFELAKAYVAIDSLQLAVKNFEKVLIYFPNSSYLKKSVLQLGLLYYNLNMNQEAIAMYKRVIADYPGSSESKDALIGIKIMNEWL